MEEDRLALELLKQIKSDAKRWFIAFIITLLLLFLSNIAWLYAWNLPQEATSTEYDIDSEDDGNAVYNGNGKVSITDGENKNKDNNNQKK